MGLIRKCDEDIREDGKIKKRKKLKQGANKKRRTALRNKRATARDLFSTKCAGEKKKGKRER